MCGNYKRVGNSIAYSLNKKAIVISRELEKVISKD